MRLTAFLGALVTLVALCGTAHARRIVYSIAVGNNEAPPADTSLPVLRYADDDAVRYHELFSRAGNNAALLTILDHDSQRRHGAELHSRPPTLVELRNVLRAFRASMKLDRERG